MKQFFIIFRHEISTYFKNKVFIFSTIFLVLAVSGFLFAPRVIESIKNSQNSTTKDEKKDQILIKSDKKDIDKYATYFSATFPQSNVKITNGSMEQIKEQLKNQSATAAFIISSDLKSYTYLKNVATLQDMNVDTMDKLLKTLSTNLYLKKHGLSDQQITEAQNLTITHKIENLSEDGTKNYWYAYIMTFVLYMVVIIFGQKVAMSVVTEKTSRAMEVLITSASPIALMFGKILASCTAGLIQIITIFGSAFISYNLNKTFFENNQTVKALFNFPASLLGFLVIFFLLGFLIYSFLYGAMGSTVSKVEDLASAIMLVQIIFVAGFVFTTLAMASGEINTPWMKFLSIFPLTSSMAMFTRLAMGEVSTIEVIASIILLIITTGVIGIIAAKIYRVGVLMYGTRPTFKSIIKAIREN